MIDWHCHILPQMDDGSHSTEESIAMLGMQASQGVDTVIATPHFYADDESVESFLERRRRSFERLSAGLPEGSPRILLGAEVRYYPGISRMTDLRSLRIQGSKLLLLEMPFSGWKENMVREVVELAGKSGVRVVLAHIERYEDLQKRSIWERVAGSGILMQSNASFFTSFSTKRRAISLLKEGRIRFIGSDCHNLTSRPPQIGKAFDVIEKKLGEDYLRKMNEYGRSLLNLNVDSELPIQ